MILFFLFLKQIASNTFYHHTKNILLIQSLLTWGNQNRLFNVDIMDTVSKEKYITFLDDVLSSENLFNSYLESFIRKNKDKWERISPT